MGQTEPALRIYVTSVKRDVALEAHVTAAMTSLGADVWAKHDESSAKDSGTPDSGDALDWCTAVIILWSQSAEKSADLEREYVSAIMLGREIVVLRTDETPVPVLLQETIIATYEGTAARVEEHAVLLDAFRAGIREAEAARRDAAELDEKPDAPELLLDDLTVAADSGSVAADPDPAIDESASPAPQQPPPRTPPDTPTAAPAPASRVQNPASDTAAARRAARPVPSMANGRHPMPPRPMRPADQRGLIAWGTVTQVLFWTSLFFSITLISNVIQSGLAPGTQAIAGLGAILVACAACGMLFYAAFFSIGGPLFARKPHLAWNILLISFMVVFGVRILLLYL